MFRSNHPSRTGEVQRHNLKGGNALSSSTRSNGPSALYPFRLSFYERAPLEEVTIEEFEGWALDRLRGASICCRRCCCYWCADERARWLTRPLDTTRPAVLADIEALLTRGRPADEIARVIAPRLKQYLPMANNTAVNVDLDAERRKDHIGHFVLRLAFCRR